MRLINCTTLGFEEFFDTQLPLYAILSHRWEDGEVSYKDMKKRLGWEKKGFQKISKCCQQSLSEGLNYAWIDTCCIDKKSSAELSEAINSMYTWYHDSEVCFVYLSDVSRAEDLASSAWFTRGWTLQELLAPNEVRFYNNEWQLIGTKRSRALEISGVTSISERVIRGTQRPQQHSVAQRMSWAATRVTTRTEDRAYCLLGLFEVNMPLLYGEGERAFRRLQKEIINESVDRTILLWDTEKAHEEQLLAGSLDDFCHFRGDWVNYQMNFKKQIYPEFSVTNSGMKLSVTLAPWAFNIYVALPNCHIYPGENPRAGFNVGFLVTPGVNLGTWKRLKCMSSQTQDENIYGQASLLVNITNEFLIRQARNMTILIDGFGIEPVDVRSSYGFTVYSDTQQLLLNHSRSSVLSCYEPALRNNYLQIEPGSSTLACVFNIMPNNSNQNDMMMIGFDFFFMPVIILASSKTLVTPDDTDRILVAETTMAMSENQWEINKRTLDFNWVRGLEQEQHDSQYRTLEPAPDMKAYRCPSTSSQWSVFVEEIETTLFFLKLDRWVGSKVQAWMLAMSDGGRGIQQHPQQ